MMHDKLKNIIFVLIIFPHIEVATGWSKFSNDTETLRSRREVKDLKRYLIFPQGSNVQLVYCMTIGTYAKPSTFFTVGATAGLAWELPYSNTVPFREPAVVYHRRSRRELYRKVELMLSTRGKDGRACVHKALCQAGKRNSSQVEKGTFMQEILHSIFTLPDGSYDEDPRTEYEKSYRVSSEDNCEDKYPTCSEMF